MCLQFANNILTFAVLERWLLQLRETDSRFVFRIYTLCLTKTPLFHYDCIFYKCWPIFTIFGTQYTELMCNITVIYLPTSSSTLPWKISQVHNDTCKLKILGILLHSLKHNKFYCTTKRVQVQLLQQTFEMSSFFLHAGPIVDSINDTL